MSHNNQLLTATAGLLHDIGKFMLRANVAGDRTWDDLARQDFRYKHAMLSATFVNQFVPEAWRGRLAGPVGNHHRPQSRVDRIVQLADHLSAGERADAVEGEETRAVHPMQLRSIFTRITLDGKAHPAADKTFLPLAPLVVDEETLFPGPALQNAAAWQRYEALWDDFSREAERLRAAHANGGDLETYLESLLLLMRRYTWCMPSAYYHSVPDVSLYDHSRMTAALAALMDREDVDDAQLAGWLAAPKKIEDELAWLIAGDISGVQDFIYTITARGATPGLRGRSFYLQLLTDAVARYVLRRLELPMTNLIYAGGGNFYLLARPGDGEKLSGIQQEISRVLLQHHRGALYLAVAGTPLQGRDFFDGRISAAWGRAHEALQDVKARRFAELPSGDLSQLFQPLGSGGNQETQCQVCGQEHAGARQDGPGGDAPYKCPACLAFEDLGDALRNARFLALDSIEPSPVSLDLSQPYGKWQDVLAALGMQAQVHAALQDVPKMADQSRRVLLALDDDGLAELRPGGRLAVGRRLLVNTTPSLRGDERANLLADPGFPQSEKDELPGAGKVKPFSVLAHQAQGIRRLGVLRMDVDSLGQIFQKGLAEHATLSRVANLSFAVSLYFEGWVGRLGDELGRQASGDRLYAIYSGGDDLFFVGAWDTVAELAIRIRADLSRYTGGHPGIHASGGLVLISGKYPLYQAAKDAGEAEHTAKSLRWRDEGGQIHTKDAFSFLGEPLPWPVFGLETDCTANLQTAHGLMHFLYETQERTSQPENEDGDAGKAAPKALVRRLIDLYGQYVAARETRKRNYADVSWAGESQVLWGPWTWRAVYTLARMEKRTKEQRIQELVDELRATDYRIMDRIGVAARWADLLGRGR